LGTGRGTRGNSRIITAILNSIVPCAKLGSGEKWDPRGIAPALWKEDSTMRILVLDDHEDGTANIRERREIFDLPEFRLSYTCSTCKTELILNPARGAPLPTADSCPICHAMLNSVDVKRSEHEVSVVAVWEATNLFREFYDFVSKHKVPLKLVVI
jgi:hypothetical protein